ncbi:MAG: hypothetical protein HC796_06770 [Synechococcaceae cyanobacterium RL_1_2]|nr:hypothetical protein [Synechococcaceae cyanobacterium RL_1_2]
MQEFQLRVVPLQNNEFALDLFQCAYKKAGQRKRPAAQKIGRLKGHPLILARQAVYDCLKQNNYDPKSLNYKRHNPYVLDEISGVNLAVLFQALKRLSKPDRIANITQGIRAMGNEEAHYWFAKMSNGHQRSAQKAIRVLLGET